MAQELTNPNAVLVSEKDLLAMLDQVRKAIVESDSMEGSISWAWSDEPLVYEVEAAYRVGNTYGQGSMVVINSQMVPKRSE